MEAAIIILFIILIKHY